MHLESKVFRHLTCNPDPEHSSHQEHGCGLSVHNLWAGYLPNSIPVSSRKIPVLTFQISFSKHNDPSLLLKVAQLGLQKVVTTATFVNEAPGTREHAYSPACFLAHQDYM